MKPSLMEHTGSVVEHVWAVETVAGPGDWVLPSSTVQVIVDLDRAEATLAGPRTVPRLLDRHRPSRLVGAVLSLGALPRLGVPTSEVRDQAPPLSDLIGRAQAVELVERVGMADNAPGGTLTRQLDACVTGAATPPWLGLAAATLQAGCPVRDVAAAVNLSPARLRAEFTAALGMTPKRFATLERFVRARRLIEQPGRGLAAVAAAAGYADQAHMTREVVRFAGCTPGALAAAHSAGDDHVRWPSSDETFKT